jgi:ubiquinone/menaquinone biosynthesis C-methylase UbiE
VSTSWTQGLFNKNYVLAEGLKHQAKSTALECDVILHLLELAPTARILDLACGHGRHTIELLKRGYVHTIGLDFSNAALEVARDTLVEQQLVGVFIEADMRELNFDAEFDAIFSVYNSLFYWDDLTHESMLRRIWNALKPRGQLLLDVSNPDAKVVRDKFYPTAFTKLVQQSKHFVARFVRPKVLRTITNSKFNPQLGLVYGTKEIWQGHQRLQTDDFQLRLYAVGELIGMLEQIGFHIKMVVSSLDPERTHLESPRVTLVAVRPEL